MANQSSRNAWSLLLLPAALALGGCGSDKGASENLGTSRSALTLGLTPATSYAIRSNPMAAVTVSLGTPPYTCSVVPGPITSGGTTCTVNPATKVVSYTPGAIAGYNIKSSRTGNYLRINAGYVETGGALGSELFIMAQSGAGFTFKAKSTNNFVRTNANNLFTDTMAGDVYTRQDCNGAGNAGPPQGSDRFGFKSAAGGTPYWQSLAPRVGTVNGGNGAACSGAAATPWEGFTLTPGTDTLKITDSAGVPNTATLVVSVENPIAFLPTSISSATPSTAITPVQTWGGSGKYTACTVTTNNSGGAGTCSLTATGSGFVSYTPGAAAGTDTLQVTDSEGHTGTFTVTVVVPFSLSASTSIATASSAMTSVTASGGTGPYSCSITTNRSTGVSCSVNGAGVVSYTAGPNAGYFIKAQKTNDYLQTVTNAANTGGAVGSTATFFKKSTALGGVSFQSMATSSYMTLADTNNSALMVNGTAATASLFSVTDCNGTGDPGLYNRFGFRQALTNNLDWKANTAALTGVANQGCSKTSTTAWEAYYLEPGTDVLTISDSASHSGTITVTVQNPLQFWPTPVVVASSTLIPTTVHAWGGSGIFTGGSSSCAVLTNASGGGACTITGPGWITYTTGAGTGTDVLRITDSQGHVADLPITVASNITPITVTPVQPPVSLSPKASTQLGASGAAGAVTYTFVTNNSGGTLTSGGVYAAGATGGVSDLIKVTDAAGHEGYLTVTVGPGISVTPGQPAVPLSGTQTFTAEGGSGTGYTWSLTSNPSGGAVTAGGAYTAGATGNTTDQLKVVDSLGNETLVPITVSCGADKSLKIIYPYNATVFPLGMLPPLVQWTDNGTGTHAEVSLRYPATGPATFYWREIVLANGPLAAPYNLLPTQLPVTGGGRAQIPGLVWRTLANAAAGQNALISVKMLEGMKGTIPATIQVRFATEQLKGNIYYGSYDTPAINTGATLKIKVGETSPTVVDGAPGACRGCHSMSADGSRAVVSDGESGPTQYQTSLTRNLISNVEATMGGTNDGRFAWPAISPDGAFLFTNSGSDPGTLSAQNGTTGNLPSALYSVPNGTAITTTGIPAGLQAMYPSFAPDTSAVAFNYNNYDGRTLAMMTTTKDSPSAGTWTFGAPIKLFTPPRNPVYTYTNGSGNAVWPSFMPAGQNGIVVQNQIRHNCFRTAGDGSSTDHNSSGFQHNIGAQGDLWWVNTTGTPTPTRLGRANGVGYLPKGYNGHGLAGSSIPGPAITVDPTNNAGGTPTYAQIATTEPCRVDLRNGIGNGDDAQLNFKPTVNPTTTGGYQWVVFMSRRMYGNVITINPYASARDGTPQIDPPGVGGKLYPAEKKLWVAAMNTTPAAGSDPSYPAFYLDGQDLYSGNSRSYWVQPQCSPPVSGMATAANLCTVDADCCQTVPTKCVLDIPIAANPAVAHCIPTSAMSCQADGAACNVDGDCCTLLMNGTRCSGNVCIVPPSGDGYPNSDQVFYDFEGTCEETGAHPVWQLLETQQIIPGDSSIKFEVQSAATAAGLVTAPKGTTHTATATAQPPLFTTGPTPVDEVLRALPTPGASRSLLRVTVTLNPSTDHTQSPTLTAVTPTYDCLFDE